MTAAAVNFPLKLPLPLALEELLLLVFPYRPVAFLCFRVMGTIVKTTITDFDAVIAACDDSSEHLLYVCLH